MDASGLAEAIADARLLWPEQYDEFIGAMLSVCQEPRILAKELVYRGWLTPFQVGRILAGQAKTLFVDSYVLLDLLGEGGMGRVFRARNWKLGRTVAVKLIGAEQAGRPAQLARFQREIRVMGSIKHPNIVQALDADIRPGTVYFAMEFFEGADLDRYVERRGPLPVAEACNYVLQVAGALQYAHEQGLIHRDIKPSNIFLTEPSHTIKLLDLGLSRYEAPINDSCFNQLTRAGAVIGTPDFMSPEQVKDSHNTDIRSDLYGLGCTFYFLLTGTAPFGHLDAVVDKLYAQCEGDPMPIEQLCPDVPPKVAAIIRKLMAKRRRDRFQTPCELAAALREVMPDLISADGETLVDAQCPTLVDAPIMPSAAEAYTLTLSRSEISLITAPQNELVEKPRRNRVIGRMIGAHFVIAMLLAASMLFVVWQAGIGPGVRRERQLPDLLAPTLINRDARHDEHATAGHAFDHIDGDGNGASLEEWPDTDQDGGGR
jgi:eukaryotic-like serine/threonine-protein kinase